MGGASGSRMNNAGASLRRASASADARRVRKLGRTGSRSHVEGHAATMGLMTAEISPLRLLVLTFAGWVSRQQQQVLEYLVEDEPRPALKHDASPLRPFPKEPVAAA